MNCIIVDDEPLARSAMRMLIGETDRLTIIGEFGNAKSAAKFLSETSVDLVFLDINMPGVSGLEFARTIPKTTLVIFTTAYAEYALDSYEVDALDYLVKPIEVPRFLKSVDKAVDYHALLCGEEKDNIDNVAADHFFVRSERKYFKIEYADILFISGLKDYSVIQLTDRRVITRMNLKNVATALPEYFIRINKSHIINTHEIVSFDNNDVIIGSHEIAIGETFRDDFFKHFVTGARML